MQIQINEDDLGLCYPSGWEPHLCLFTFLSLEGLDGWFGGFAGFGEFGGLLNYFRPKIF